MPNRSSTRAADELPFDTFGSSMSTETSDASSPPGPPDERERLAYSIHEAANLLGVDYLVFIG
jgi:hypothetical protein